MKPRLILIIALLILLSLACSMGAGEPTPTPNLDETVEAALAQTIAAQPTDTATVTLTPTPMMTETPLPTHTPTETLTPTPAEELPAFSVEALNNEWSQYSYHQDGFSIALPPGWEHLDLSVEDLDQMLTYASESNSELGQIFTSEYLVNLAASGMKFMAVDISAASLGAGIPTSLNLLVMELPLIISLETIAEATVGQLEAFFGDNIDVQYEMIEINDIEAAKISYETEIENVLGKPHLVVFNQYLIIEDDTQYIMTFSTVAEMAEANQPVFAEIVNSFKFLP